MKRDLREILSLGFDLTINDLTDAINNLTCFISELSELYKDDNTDKQAKKNIACLIKNIDLLDDSINNIEEIYKQVVKNT